VSNGEVMISTYSRVLVFPVSIRAPESKEARIAPGLSLSFALLG
jgi:hypothetical protein